MFSIVIAAIVSVIVGGIWFGPKTFFPVMMKELGQSNDVVNDRMKRFNPPLHFGLVIVGELVLASILYVLLNATDGNLLVIFLPIIFVLASNIKTNVFSYLNLKLFAVQEGQKAVSILIMGLIIKLMM